MELTDKERPILLEDCIGNITVKQTLQAQLARKQLFPKIIFTGHAGVGKTTMAMATALALQCPNSVDGRPCLECETCKEIIDTLIHKGQSCCDIEIINMADKKTIETARELIERLNWGKSKYNYRIFICEEPQNTSEQVQDVLLKPLEHLLPHVVILFTTTNIRKLNQALVSRCTTMDLKPPTEEETVEHLRRTCLRNYKVNPPVNALKLIIDYTNNIPRDAMIALEKVVSTGIISVEQVNKVLGKIDFQLYIDFFNTLQYDFVKIAEFIQNIRNTGTTYVSFVQNLGVFTTDVFKMKFNIPSSKYTSKQYTECRKLFNKYSYKDFMRIQILSSSLSIPITNTYLDEQNAESRIITFALNVSQNFSFEEISTKNENATKQAEEKYKQHMHEEMIQKKQQELTANDIVSVLGSIKTADNKNIEYSTSNAQRVDEPEIVY